jgi:hypothetical protein
MNLIWTTVSDDALLAALACCRGSYQRELILGAQAWSGSTLVGKAASYGSHYKESREHLIRRLRGGGLTVEFARVGRGRRIVARIYGGKK